GPPLVTYICRNMTMPAFAQLMRNMAGVGQYLNGASVVDKTGVDGAWDFDFKYTLRGPFAAQGDGITIFDAVDRQLGLKLEAGKAPIPVIVVVSANQKPTDNAAGVADALRGGAPPTEFEVADVKPANPDFDGDPINVQPGGRVHLAGMTLQNLIQMAWDLRPDMLVGAPKWINDDRWDVLAKAPAAAESSDISPGMGPQAPAGPMVSFDAVLIMLRGLLKERFKLAMHEEERPADAYKLIAVKPKMKKADPAGRTKFTAGTGATPGARVITIQNMTMAQFASQLQRIAPAYIQSPVLDATALDGAYDFTLTFAPAEMARGGGAGGRGAKRGPGQPEVAAGNSDASDPTGLMSLPEAIDKQ